MKTILILSWFYLPFVGGAELFLKAITDRLGGRFRFVIVTARMTRRLPRFEEENHVELVRAGIGHPVDKFLYPLPAVWEALSRSPVDLIHAVMVNASAIAAYTYSRIRRCPTLLTLQDGDSEEYVRNYLGPLFPIYPRLHRPFDRIHAISRFLETQAVHYGADPSSIRVIPNGVDIGIFRPKSPNADRVESLRRELGLSGKRVIVSVSRLVRKNGIDTLLDALPAIREHHPDVVLVLVGDGSDRRGLEARADELGIRNAVRFAGSVEHERTVDYLQLADLFARPSRSEGLGSAFLEAMACGIPVLATPVGGIPDFLRHEENGLLVEAESERAVARATDRLLSDGTLAKRLSEEGLRLVRSRYRWDTLAEQIGELYEELLFDR